MGPPTKSIPDSTELIQRKIFFRYGWGYIGRGLKGGFKPFRYGWGYIGRGLKGVLSQSLDQRVNSAVLAKKLILQSGQKIWDKKF